MGEPTRDELIERYREGYRVVEEALARVGTGAIDRAAGDGWTPRQVVHHLADSEMTSAIRLRRLLALDRPVIEGYDENAFASRLRYSDRPIEPALAAFRAARETTSQLLDSMTDEDWSREGTHTESGRYTAEDWLRIYAAHGHDHAAQILASLG